MKFTSLFVLASVVVSGFATSANDIRADISDIYNRVVVFNDAITNGTFTGETLAPAIQTTVNDIYGSLEKGKGDANSIISKVSVTDGHTFAVHLQYLRSSIEHALRDFVAKKTEIEEFLDSAAVNSDLSELKDGFNDLVGGLDAIVPDEFHDRTAAFKTGVNKAFDDANAAYEY